MFLDSVQCLQLIPLLHNIGSADLINVWIFNRACYLGVHYWNYYPGALIFNSSPLDNMADLSQTHFADDIFNCIFVNEKLRILIQISLNFVPKGPIDNKSALVQVMAWRRTGDKLLPEAMIAEFTDALYAALGGDEFIRRSLVVSYCLNGNLWHSTETPHWVTNKMTIMFMTFSMQFLDRKLTHWGRVTHICVNKLDHHWFR